jgi:hypothetical protein
MENAINMNTFMLYENWQKLLKQTELDLSKFKNTPTVIKSPVFKDSNGLF